MQFKNWRKIATLLHRDLGYFFAGMVIIYALSGVALNHRDHWDPSFIVDRREIATPYANDAKNDVSRSSVSDLFEKEGINDTYRGHDFPSPSKLKIFTKKGSLFIDTESGTGEYEALKRRPVFYQVNFLHLHPGLSWTVFSDIFCVGLLIITLTGVVMRKGRHGLRGRGGWFTALGIILPFIFLIIL